MLTCPNCKLTRIKILDLNYAENKSEGEPASKANPQGRQFYCWDCEHKWRSVPEAEELYLEYSQLKDETTLIVESLGRGMQYHPQYIDPVKLHKRKELEKIIVNSYQHLLDLSPEDWWELKQNASS